MRVINQELSQQDLPAGTKEGGWGSKGSSACCCTFAQKPSIMEINEADSEQSHRNWFCLLNLQAKWCRGPVKIFLIKNELKSLNWSTFKYYYHYLLSHGMHSSLLIADFPYVANKQPNAFITHSSAASRLDSLVSSSLALLLVLQAASAGNDAVQLYIETYAFLWKYRWDGAIERWQTQPPRDK